MPGEQTEGKTHVSEPHALSEAGLHEAVVRIISSWPQAMVLDAGAGEGCLSLRLSEAGISTIAVDRDPSGFAPPNVPMVCCDLGTGLPFGDSTFDIVCCLDVIEHVEDPFAVTRELERVLRPGGRLILSTPNILRVASRFWYFWRGFHSAFSPQLMGIDSVSAGQLSHCITPYGYHVNPLSLLELILVLQRSGLTLVDVHSVNATHRRVRRLMRWVFRLVYAVVRRFSSEWSYVSPQIEDWLVREEVLADRTLIVEAVKR